MPDVPPCLRFEHRAQSMSVIRSMGVLSHIDMPVRELLVKLANEVDDLRGKLAAAQTEAAQSAE